MKHPPGYFAYKKGDIVWDEPVAAGESLGHAFRGNRYTGGIGGEAVIKAIMDAAHQGGGSVQNETGKPPPPIGHMVAGVTSVVTLDPATMSATDMRDAITTFQRQNAKVLHGQYIGVWTNHQDQIEMEGSQLNTGSRTDALQLGFERDQVAVWDNMNGVEVPVMSDGNRPSESTGTRVT